MIKLAMPAFNPREKLVYHFTVRVNIGGTYDPGSTTAGITLSFWGDPFTDWITIQAPGVLVPSGAGWWTYETEARAEIPVDLGLTGGEGWCSIAGDGPHLFVTDCIVSYTPATASDGRSSVGHFT